MANNLPLSSPAQAAVKREPGKKQVLQCRTSAAALASYGGAEDQPGGSNGITAVRSFIQPRAPFSNREGRVQTCTAQQQQTQQIRGHRKAGRRLARRSMALRQDGVSTAEHS